MNNLAKLVKINILTLFDLHKLVNAKSWTDYKKLFPKLLLYIYAFGALTVSIYYFANFAIKGLTALGTPYLILVVMMAMTSVYLVLATVFKVNRTVFDAKDYPILLSLPIQKNIIISSKLAILYISNLIITLFFMLPTYLAYTISSNPNLLFHLLFIISLIFIPLVPTVVGAIIGSILTALVANFKYKILMNILLSIILLLTLMYFSYASGSITTDDLANLSEGIINYFSRFYPLTRVYLSIVSDYNVLSLVIYITISVGLFWLFSFVLSYYFDQINSKLTAITINNKYKINNLKVSHSLLALYKKELKRYFSSVMYVLNTGVGAILLIVALLVLAFVGSEQLDGLLTIPGFSDLLAIYGPLVFCVFCALSCTTNASISLEGKNLWLLKTLPISPNKIFIAKILVNLTILIPTIILGAFLLTFILSLNILTFLLLLFTPTMFALFIAGLGLLTNLYFPDFTWTNEIKVIKQSLPVFITLASGMFLSIIPLLIKIKINPNLYSLLYGLIMVIMVLVTYYILFTKGKKVFKAL